MKTRFINLTQHSKLERIQLKISPQLLFQINLKYYLLMLTLRTKIFSIKKDNLINRK